MADTFQDSGHNSQLKLPWHQNRTESPLHYRTQLITLCDSVPMQLRVIERVKLQLDKKVTMHKSTKYGLFNFLMLKGLE